MTHTIYLSGPSSRVEDDDPFAWRNAIVEKYGILHPKCGGPDDVDDAVVFINPFTYGDDRPYNESADQIRDKQERAFDDSDGVVMRWNAKASAGTAIEARMAYEYDLPLILVQENEAYVPKVLSAYPTIIVEDDGLAGVDMLLHYLTQ